MLNMLPHYDNRVTHYVMITRISYKTCISQFANVIYVYPVLGIDSGFWLVNNRKV